MLVLHINGFAHQVARFTFFLLAMALFGTATTQAQGTDILSVSSVSGTVGQSRTISIGANFNSVSGGVVGYDLEISYDPTRFVVTAVSNSNSTFSSFLPNLAGASSGSVSVAAVGVTPSQSDNISVTITLLAAPGGTVSVSGSFYDTDDQSFDDDGQGTVTIAPGAANQPPVANDDQGSVTLGSSVTINVLANDTDPDGNALTIQSVGNPAHGTAQISSGKIRYTPATGYTGSDAFSYTVSDGQGGTDAATVSVTVNAAPVNRAPQAGDDQTSVISGDAVLIDVLSNDSDPDGNTLSIVSATTPAHGSASITGGKIRYTPASGYTGTDSFQYTITDGQLTDDGTVNVTVTAPPTNTPPVAVNDVASTGKSRAVVIDVLSNDTDAENNTLTLTAVSTPLHGTTAIESNKVRYTPASDYTGPDSFTYTVSDGHGGLDDASVTVIVLPDDDEDGVADDEEDDAPNQGDGNDDGIPDSRQANVTSIVSNASSGAYVTVASPSGTTLVEVEIEDNPAPNAPDAPTPSAIGFLKFGVEGLNSGAATTVELFIPAGISYNSYWKYGPTPDKKTDHWYEFAYDGTTGAEILPGKIVLHFVDGQRGDHDLTVNGNVLDPGAPVLKPNQTLTAVGDLGETEEDTPVEIDVLANDIDAGGNSLSVTAVSNPSVATILAGGKIRYTPPANFNGTGTFLYTLSNGKGGTAQGTVSVEVHPVNDTPRFIGSTFIEPIDGAQVTIGGGESETPSDPTDFFTFRWNDAQDPDEDVLTYIWQLSASDTFTEKLLSVQTDSVSSVETLQETLIDLLDDLSVDLYGTRTLYHRVIASDGQVTTTSPVSSVVFKRGTLTASETDYTIPDEFALQQNYPNPFNPATTIVYDLPQAVQVTVIVYDLLGKEVGRLVDGPAVAGRHTVEFDAGRLSSGAYLYRIHAGSFVATRSMMLVK